MIKIVFHFREDIIISEQFEEMILPNENQRIEVKIAPKHKNIFKSLLEGVHLKDFLAFANDNRGSIKKLILLNSLVVSLRNENKHIALIKPVNEAFVAKLEHVYSLDSKDLIERLKMQTHTYANFFDQKLVINNPLAFGSIAILDENFETYLFKVLKNKEQSYELTLLFYSLGFLRKDDANEVYDQWEFQDILYDANTTLGYSNHSDKIGGYKAKQRSYSLPGIFKEESVIGTSILNEDNQLDSRFFDFSKKRTSSTDFNELPIEFSLLSELLKRLTHIRSTKSLESMDVAFKNYPSGGALHEHEIYLLINNVKNIMPGFYYYNQKSQELVLKEIDSQKNDLLNKQLHSYLRSTSQCQLALYISSRILRRMWKYKGLAYRHGLIGSGALLLYAQYICTELELKSCPVGLHDSDFMATMSKTSRYREPFMLGLAVGR